jgi:hypothetical protein
MLILLALAFILLATPAAADGSDVATQSTVAACSSIGPDRLPVAGP